MKNAYRKGRQKESKITKWLKRLGLKATLVPRSGAAEGFKGDVMIDMTEFGYNHLLIAEVKARKDGLRTVRRWLGDCDLLFFWRDREASPVVIMPGPMFEELVEIILTLKGGRDED